MLAGTFEANAHLQSRSNTARDSSVFPADYTPDCAIETVYVIDDDTEARDGISVLLASLNRVVVSFASLAAYRCHKRSGGISCLILEMRCLGVDGFAMQEHATDDVRPTTIYVSGYADIPSTVRAMKAGAIDCLTKPIDREALRKAVTAALAHDRRMQRKQSEVARLQHRLSLLTKREREVLPLVVGGALNKQAASVLGISEVTLQIHRSQVMRKMQANSLADLVRMSIKLRVPHWQGNA